ncbi:MAG: nickel pincer cofactor biosynthesis protein LarC [Candidatus Methanospirareceae archaeon]
MRAVVLEPFSGAAGDMILGSLLALGVKESKIADAISAFNLALEVTEVEKCGIMAKHVAFVATRAAAERSSSDRSYTDMRQALEQSGLPEPVVQHAVSAFERIAQAEAIVHGIPREKIIFHELGALDTLGDLVGCAVAFRELNPDTIISTPISLGTGFVQIEHGCFPVPAPATLEILRDTTLLYHAGPAIIDAELLTPTGAALLAQFVERSVLAFPQLRIEKIGYGAGSQDLPVPNVLRASTGTLTELSRDQIEVLETNVDNVTGEMMGNLIEVLMAEGARDVAVAPVLMKKGRTGYLITVITTPQDAARIAQRLMVETGTLGVRVMQVKHRFVADREEARVTVTLRGVEREVGIKIGRDAAGKVITVAAEFEDAKRVARELNMPLKDVLKAVEGTFFYT